ncbi:MAG: thioredoxin family protein [Legionellales bacterium]|nr:thioredoxin family protein [Legionellales bacterium]
MAIWMLGRLLPSFWLSLLWAAFLVLSAFIFGIWRHEVHFFGRVLQGFAVCSLMSAGALAYKNIWLETKITTPAVVSASFEPANSVDIIKTQLARAKEHHQPVFIEFFATWCSDCQAMDSHVFNQPEVVKAMNGAVNLRVNLSDKNESVAAIKKTFGIYGIPTMVFYNADGQKLETLGSVGQISKNQMLSLLDKFKTLQG